MVSVLIRKEASGTSSKLNRSDNLCRAPFDTLLTQLADTKTPIMSVDVPSGWHVENGPILPNSKTGNRTVKLQF